jgi:phage terminase large subunit GpA-like protein
MSALKFSCPKTGEEIHPGIEDIDPAAAALHFSALYVRCRHCGEHHEIKIEQAALNEAA